MQRGERRVSKLQTLLGDSYHLSNQVENWELLVAATYRAKKDGIVTKPRSDQRLKSLNEDVSSLPDLRNPVPAAAWAPPRIEVHSSEAAPLMISPVDRQIRDSLTNIEAHLRTISVNIIEGNKRNEEAHRLMSAQLDLSNRLNRRVMDQFNAFYDGTEADLPPFE
ncbi:hypothetical protein ACHAPU_003623 [Fusarium lateritium]